MSIKKSVSFFPTIKVTQGYMSVILRETIGLPEVPRHPNHCWPAEVTGMLTGNFP